MNLIKKIQKLTCKNVFCENAKLKNELALIRKEIIKMKINEGITEQGSILWSLGALEKKKNVYKSQVKTVSDCKKCHSGHDRLLKICTKLSKDFSLKITPTLTENLHEVYNLIIKYKKVMEFHNHFYNDPIESLHNYFFDIPRNNAVAYGFTSCAETKILGCSLLALRTSRLKLYKIAEQHLSSVSNDFMTKYIPLVAAEVLSRENTNRFIEFIDYILKEKIHIPINALTESGYALLSMNEYFRVTKLIQLHENCVDSASEVEKRPLIGIYKEISRLNSKNPAEPTSDNVNIGILSYYLPARLVSCNIGDYFQTIAMLGQIYSSGLRHSAKNGEDFPMLDCIIEKCYCKKDKEEVNFCILDRDYMKKENLKSEIWLPYFGWMSHQLFDREEGFQFDENINPLFISFHLARPHVLCNENISTLKKYQPIGCRDYTTVRILKSFGIRAFFSGCVTSTINSLYKKNKTSEIEYASAHSIKNIAVNSNEIFISQTIPDLLYDNFNEALKIADNILEKYSKAKNVKTTLLHCYLPCKSMGIPVQWMHKLHSDRRFEGLIDIDDKEFRNMQKRFQKLQYIFRTIAKKKDKNIIYSIWENIWKEEEKSTDIYLDEFSKQLSIIEKYQINHDISTIKKEIIGVPCFDIDDKINIVLAFDTKYIKHALTTIQAITSKSSQEIYFHLLVRNINTKELKQILTYDNVTGATLYDCSPVTFDNLRLLDHTNVSTMDRLLIPELLCNINKAIYLDVDILVRKDITSLWNIDISQYPFAARVSIHREWKRGISLTLEIAERFDAKKARLFRQYLYNTGALDFDCFNAGVLLMNLDFLRKDNASQEMLSLAKYFGIHDQFCLNIYSRGNYLQLPPEWNHFYFQEYIEDPAITHYIGKDKPWNCKNIPFSKEWTKFESN